LLAAGAAGAGAVRATESMVVGLLEEVNFSSVCLDSILQAAVREHNNKTMLYLFMVISKG
jgi:hypothetical protein